MKFILLLLLFLITIQKSTQKRHRRKVALSSNSSDVQNVNCHNCRKVVEGSEGFITSVNNASDYFYELIYGWNIEVPMYNDILLTFSWSNEESSQNKTPPCKSCKPYFEIIYGYSTIEETFKVNKFYNIRQLKKLSVPSHKTEIRFFSGVQCNESQKLENAGFSISFKAIPLEQTWSLYTLLSVLIPTGFIILGVAYFCVIMKKKDENNHEVPSLPIPIYVDLENPASEFKKGKAKEKMENKGRGLRLRTHLSSRLEEPKEITVISSLAESETFESSAIPNQTTPDSSNSVPVVAPETKKYFFKKRLPPKVNLLSRYSRSATSTPKYASFHDEADDEDRLSKSDIVIFEKRKVSRKVFDFDVLPPKEDPIPLTELETSVFLHSSSASSGGGLPNGSICELPFVSPK